MLGGIEGSILDAYGGEYEWDRFNVILHSARGVDRDFSIRYGVNMLDYNEEIDSSGTYMACIPYWTDGTLMVIGDKQTADGSTITNRGECIPLDVSDKFESMPTKAQVNAMGKSVIDSQNPTIPSQNIKVEFVRLQDLGYEGFENLFKCRLCDTIKIEFPRYGMSGQFKIVRTVYDVLSERFEEMELGTLSVTLSEALGLDSGGFGGNGGTADSGIVDHYGAITGASIADKSLSSGSSWQNIGAITLPDGAWLLYLTAVFASNSSGYRLLTVADTSAAAGTGIRTVRRAPTNGAATTIAINCPLEGGKTYYINGVQNSGSALTVQTRYTAVKIGKNYTA